jgi:hypothetical protein
MLAARAFEPDFLRRLDGLMIQARRSRAPRAGRRILGRIQGAGIELEDFREYAPGDDLRFLDWNALARLDDLKIRTFRPERQIEVTIMVDASASMGLPADDDKLGFALTLAAGLAYIGMSENDPVRIAIFSGHGPAARFETTPFFRRHESYAEFRPFFATVRGGGETRLSEAAARLLGQRRAPGVAMIVSDFLVGPGDYETAFNDLLAAGFEAKAVHVMGDRESAVDYPPGNYRVRDCETGVVRDVSFGPREMEACRRRIAAHADALADFCKRRGVMYARAFGASKLDEIVASEFPRLGVIA